MHLHAQLGAHSLAVQLDEMLKGIRRCCGWHVAGRLAHMPAHLSEASCVPAVRPYAERGGHACEEVGGRRILLRDPRGLLYEALSKARAHGHRAFVHYRNQPAERRRRQAQGRLDHKSLERLDGRLGRCL